MRQTAHNTDMRIVARSVAAFVLLVALQLALLDGFWNHLDLHGDDGVLHLHNGLALASGQMPEAWLAWAPIVTLLHSCLYAVGVPVHLMQDTQTVLVSIASTTALCFLLRPLVGEAPALLVAALWATTPLALHRVIGIAPPQTYLLSAALCWFGAGMAVRRRWAAAALLLGLAAFERGEQTLPIAAAAVVAAIRSRRDRRPLLLLAALAAVIFAFHQLHGPSHEHGALAFRQHYASGAVMRGDNAPGSDFARPDATIVQDFGDAATPIAAFRRNPRAVASYVRDNLVRLPIALDTMLLQPFGHAPAWRWTVLGAIGLFAAWIAWRRRAWMRRILVARREAFVALGVGALAALPIPLLLLSRPDLMTAVVPVAAMSSGLLLRSVASRRVIAARSALLLVAAAIVFAPRPFAGGIAELREVRSTVRILQRQVFRPGDVVCTAWAPQMTRFVRAGADVRGVALRGLQADTPQACAMAFAAADPDVVLLSPSTIPELGVLGQVLAAELATDRWEIADYFFPTLSFRRVR